MKRMKIKLTMVLVAISALFSLLTPAAYADETSSWAGTGVLFNEDSPAPVTIAMHITATFTTTKFRFHDCWDNSSQNIHGCIGSDYDVDSNAQIFQSGKKVGDIFPGHIVMFIGNEQVSEQIVIDFDEATPATSKTLRYQYTFSTYDGLNLVRRGTLTPKK